MYKIIARLNVYVYVLCSCDFSMFYIVRTFTYSQAKCEVYINEKSSRVVYVGFNFVSFPFIFNNSNSLQAPLLHISEL